jgi:Electron transfer DM13
VFCQIPNFKIAQVDNKNSKTQTYYYMSKRSILSVLLILVIIASLGGFYFYNSALTKSKEEGTKIISRATSSQSKTIPKLNVQSKELKSGSFVTLDPVHYAKGNVKAVQNGDNVTINFSQDFETNPEGPDLYVWLVKKQEIKNIALGGLSSKAGDYLDLGAIQSKSGTQSYQVKASEFQDYDYAVVIWCRAFGIQFSNAILQ